MKQKIIKITDVEMDALVSAVYTQVDVLKKLGKDREAKDDIKSLKRVLRKLGRRI